MPNNYNDSNLQMKSTIFFSPMISATWFFGSYHYNRPDQTIQLLLWIERKTEKFSLNVKKKSM